MHTEILSLSAIQKPEPRPTSEMLDLYRLQADRDLEDTLLRISPRMGRAMRLSDSTRVMTRAIIDEIPVQFMYPRGGAGDLVERTAFLASIYLKHLSTTSYTLPWNTPSTPKYSSSTKNIPRILVNAYQFGEGDDRGDSGVFKDFFLNKISSLRVLTPEEMKDIDLDEHLDIMTRGKNTDQKQGSFCLQYYSDAEYFAQFRHWMHREFDPILQAKLIK